MTKQLLISQLRQGKNGNDILHILDVLCSGMDSSESSQDNVPTLDEIQFWNSTRCVTFSSGTSFSTRPAPSTRLCTSRREHHATRICYTDLEESKESLCESHGQDRDLYHRATDRQQGLSYIIERQKPFLGNAWQRYRLDGIILRQGRKGFASRLMKSHPARRRTDNPSIGEVVSAKRMGWCPSSFFFVLYYNITVVLYDYEHNNPV